RIENAFGAERQRRDDAAQRVNDRRNAGIRRARQRQSLFNGPYARLLEMLVRTWAAPEPAVVRQIEHPAWPTPVADNERPAQIVTKMVIKPSAPIVVRHCIARENDFVTNQRQHVGCARYRQVAPPIASNEA